MDAAFPPDTPRSPVQQFTLKVIGGLFTVAQVLLSPGQSAGQAVESIRGQPSDRWLVMAAAQQGGDADALALINDAYECQVVALGTLKPDAS